MLNCVLNNSLYADCKHWRIGGKCNLHHIEAWWKKEKCLQTIYEQGEDIYIDAMVASCNQFERRKIDMEKVK